MTWIRNNDNEMPRSIGMDIVSNRIFMITSSGFFSVYDSKTFEVIYKKKFNKTAFLLESFKLSNLVMIVFEHDIIVLDSSTDTITFDDLKEYSLTLNTITMAKINTNEKLLAVATVSAAQPEVTLFAIDNGFAKLKQIFGFKSSVKYLDFSSDNYYMQIEDTVGEVTLYEIETDRPIQTDAIDFELEWLGEGLRTYQKLKGVRHQYNQHNKIV